MRCDSLAKREEVELRTFLMGDAVGCALAHQQTPEGDHNVARTLKGLTARNAPIGLCGTCLDTRGLASRSSSMARSARTSLLSSRFCDAGGGTRTPTRGL